MDMTSTHILLIHKRNIFMKFFEPPQKSLNISFSLTAAMYQWKKKSVIRITLFIAKAECTVWTFKLSRDPFEHSLWHPKL